MASQIHGEEIVEEVVTKTIQKREIQNMESLELMVDWRGRPADRNKTGTWKAAWRINVLNVGDTVATVSIGLNLVNYLTSHLHLAVSKASNTVTNFFGTTFLLPLFWGFLADAYLGRFWTIAIGGVIATSGLALMTYSVVHPSIQPAPCVPTLTSACPPAGSQIMRPFTISLYLIALGSSAMKPTMSAMGADQFDDTEPTERAKGVKFFMWFFAGIQIGLLTSSTLFIYFHGISEGVGVGAALGVMVLCILLFSSGFSTYRHKPPSGSPLTRMAQVIVAAARNWNVPVPKDVGHLYEVPGAMSAIKGSRKLGHSNTLKFLDKAAVKTYSISNEGELPSEMSKNGPPPSPWRLCTVTQVEELKRILGMMPIWCCTSVVYISYAQLSSFTIIQGLTLDRHLGANFKIPPVSLSAVIMVFTFAFLLSIYERMLVPAMRRLTGDKRGLSPLQRIGTGLFLTMLAYLVAVGIEKKRLRLIRELGFQHAPIGTFELPMSVFWMVPVFVPLACVEVFTTVGQLDFFYDESSDGTRSIGMSFFFTATSMGYFLSTILVNAVDGATKNQSAGAWLSTRLNNGGLLGFYYVLAGIMAVDFLVFLVVSSLYKYKKDSELVDVTGKELDNESSVSTRPAQ